MDGSEFGSGHIPKRGIPEERTMIPYPKMGSGHAVGSDTSRERQELNDATGVTSRVQQLALAALLIERAEGVTAAELEDRLNIGHGMASSALSHLHRAGRVRRVKMRRKRHEIYMLPEYVNGREESPYRPRLKPAKHPRDYTDDQILELLVKAGFPKTAEDKLFIVKKVFEVMP